MNTNKKKILIISGIIIVCIVAAMVFIVNMDNKGKSNANTSSSGQVKSEKNTEGEKSSEINSDEKVSKDDNNETSTNEQSDKQAESTTSEEQTEIQSVEETTAMNIEQVSKQMYIVSSANVRQGPGMSDAVIGKLTYGQEIMVTGKAGEWYQFNYNGTSAYVHYSLVSENKPEKSNVSQNSGNEIKSNENNVNNKVNTGGADNTGVNNAGNTDNINKNDSMNNTNNSNQNSNSQGDNFWNFGNSNASVDTSGYIDEVIRLVNEERAKAGLQPLKKNSELCNAAGIRAEEIVNVFDHTRPDGRDCFSVLDDNNINYMTVGENIAAGQSNPSGVMYSWMNSPGHRSNILNESFGQIGIGFVKGKGSFGTYWVQIFTN